MRLSVAIELAMVRFGFFILCLAVATTGLSAMLTLCLLGVSVGTIILYLISSVVEVFEDLRR